MKVPIGMNCRLIKNKRAGKSPAFLFKNIDTSFLVENITYSNLALPA